MTALLLKIYDQRRPLEILVKDVIMISRNIAFETVKGLNKRYVKLQLFFFGSKAINLKDGEPGDELGSWLSQFVSVSFFHRNFFFNFCFF